MPSAGRVGTASRHSLPWVGLSALAQPPPRLHRYSLSANGVRPLLVQRVTKFGKNTRIKSHSQEGSGLTPCSAQAEHNKALEAGLLVAEFESIARSYPSTTPNRIILDAQNRAKELLAEYPSALSGL